jgi:hypothetical protein
VAGVLAAALLVGAAPALGASPAPTGTFRLSGNIRNGADTNLTLAKIGAPTFQTVNVRGVSRKALVFAELDGLALSGIPTNARRTFTIDVLFEHDDMVSYGRILSFGPNDQDPGLYLYDGYPSLYDVASNEAVVVASNTFTRVRVTRSAATKVMRVYVNGTQAFRYTDVGDQYILRQGRVVFFKDDADDDENPSGTVAGITVWNRVVAP